LSGFKKIEVVFKNQIHKHIISRK